MKKIVSVFLIAVSFNLAGQSFVAGNTYFGTDSLIEYQCGNLPIILSSPHGGYLTPSVIPDRNCTGCVTGRDSYTQELTRSIAASILWKTGCYPHVIINRLHRKKLDANREITEATDSNFTTETYWHDYMNFCDTAKSIVSIEHQKGLFLDIHGHGHTIQRIELGYRLTGTDLRKNDSSLNVSPINGKTSILNLRFSNLNSHSHAELIRGQSSFGSILQRKGYPTVPSDSIPFPLIGEPYFNGGYNTQRFGSNTGGTIDAIQIESNQSIRFDLTKRTEYADSLASVIIRFMENHYFNHFSSNACNTALINEIWSSKLIPYPNPTDGFLYIKGLFTQCSYKLFSIAGRLMRSGDLTDGEPINLNKIHSGVYILTIKQGDNQTTHKIVKK